jgi:hypothetical protein
MAMQTAPTVRQRGIGNDVLLLTTLTDIMYVDAHVLETPRATERTAERWARAIMEDTTDCVQEQLTAAWAAIQLDLAPGTEGTIAGWHISSSTPKHVLLQVNSGLGFRGELAVTVTDGAVLMATFVAMADVHARDAWFRVVPAHLAFVRSLLEHAKEKISS